MISKAKIKYIKSLEQKKFRRSSGCFVAEGPKVVGELLDVMQPRMVVAESSWLTRNEEKLQKLTKQPGQNGFVEIVEVDEEELRKVSFLQHPQEVLGVFTISETPADDVVKAANSGLSLALDGVQDHGNLGTIIRVADWFGIRTVFCSPMTADIYSPKALQATMGSVARVQTVYMDLAELFHKIDKDLPVYGTFLDGDNIYTTPLSDKGIIVMGNEGNGISAQTAAFISKRLLIPNYPVGVESAESLNVAIATALTCAEFRLRM